MSEVWSKWTGHVVNGTFPLRRYLGASDHSGVFLTEFTGREPREVAIKLVRAIPTLVESHGAQWEAAAELANPHLVQLLEAGQCQLDGLPYLYLVMEYADQTLAQLLEHRAMAEDEAREMLLPILDTLAFLHNRNMVQGQLKPANILVIGEKLKLASDTIRNVSDATASINMVSVYDPPEVHDGSVTTAGDMWALGITLFEALTRSPPIGMDVRREGITLPPDFSPMFRDIVASCLSRRPFDRPKAAELAAKMRGQSLESEGGASGADVSDRAGGEPDGARAVSIDSSNGGAADRAASSSESAANTAGGFASGAVPGGTAGAEASTPEASASTRPASPASLAVSVLDKLVSILGPGSRPSAAVAQAPAVAPDVASTGPRPMLDAPAATPKTAGQPTPVAPVGGAVAVTNRSGAIAGPGSGAYSAGTVRGGSGAVPDGNSAGRPSGVTPAGVAGAANRPGGIAGPGSAVALGSTAAAAGVRGTAAPGVSVPSTPEAGTKAPPRGVSSPAVPGATAQGVMPGSTGALAGTARSAMNPPLDSSGRYRAVPPSAGSPAAAGSAGANASPAAATDVSGRYRSVPGASPSAPGVGATPGGSAGATDASGRYRSVPGAGVPGGSPGAIDASGRYRTVATPAQQGSPPNRTSPVVSSGMTSAPSSTTPPPARPAASQTPPAGGAQNRSASVSASVSTSAAAAARAAAAAAESNAASRIASATGSASSAAGRTASTPIPDAVNRPAPPPGARVAVKGAPDVSALNRPPFAGAIPHPVSPAATADQTTGQRPTPRPIVIEHFTPESLLPADTGRRSGTNTPQPPAAPPSAPKESSFVASNAASGHVDSPELTPSDVAAALESESVSDQEPTVPRVLLPLTIGVVVVLALALMGVYVLRTHTNSTPPVVETYQDPPLPTQADATPPVTAADEPAPAPPADAAANTLRPGDAATPASPSEQSAASSAAATQTATAAPSGVAAALEAAAPAETGPSAETAPPAEIHEELPDIPPHIRASIRGHVRVAVRLIVDKEGSVFAALVDEPGPSRYFEKLAIEAAKKWTFPPMDTTGSRLELVRFDFTRQGATGRAVEIE